MDAGGLRRRRTSGQSPSAAWEWSSLWRCRWHHPSKEQQSRKCPPGSNRTALPDHWSDWRTVGSRTTKYKLLRPSPTRRPKRKRATKERKREMHQLARSNSVRVPSRLDGDNLGFIILLCQLMAQRQTDGRTDRQGERVSDIVQFIMVVTQLRPSPIRHGSNSASSSAEHIHLISAPNRFNLQLAQTHQRQY